MPFTRQLREKRGTLAEQARAILDTAEREGRELTSEESVSFDRIHADIETIGEQIRRAERQDALDAELRSTTGVRAGRADVVAENAAMPAGAGDAEARTQAVNRAFRSYLRYGLDGLDSESRAIMVERRAQATTPGTAGGYTIAPDFLAQLETALQAFGGMREAATVIRSETGATLPMPTQNDTANEGVILGENTAVAMQDITFGVVNLSAFMYSSKAVLVSLQLLQDTAFNVDQNLAERLAERIARIQNRHFTVGTGAGQPNGVVTAAGIGKTGAVGQTTSVTFDDLVDLEHSVDPAYRQNSVYMFHDTTLKALKKLKDGYGRPLWLPGYATQDPDTINGKRYVINQHMPVMAASAKSVLFGDFSKYVIRDVMGTSVLRLAERYADAGQVGFLSWARADGTLLDAGAGPIKAYANSAT